MLFGFSLLIQFTIPAWGLLVVSLPFMLAMQEALQLSNRRIVVLGQQRGGQAALAPPAGCGWGNGAQVLWVLLHHSIHDLNSVHAILCVCEREPNHFPNHALKLEYATLIAHFGFWIESWLSRPLVASGCDWAPRPVGVLEHPEPGAYVYTKRACVHGVLVGCERRNVISH